MTEKTSHFAYAFLDEGTGGPVKEGQEENIVEKWEKLGVIFIPASSGDGGTLVNSYLITDSQEITKYAKYLMYESEYASYFSGSLEGFVFEWMFHNIAYAVLESTEDKARAKDLDVGRTIYSDSHGWKSYLMLRAFEILYPDQAKQDILIHNSY